MKVGERGQVTIPKSIRDRFGIGPNAEVEFRVDNGTIILQKKPGRISFRDWKGRWRNSLRDLGYSSVDEYIEDIRGR